ncbi:MAG: hypothetical protein JKY53_09080 [Flavobacteriales bacterium]|nr:hypothetical protein [Flavobacteriales bacterium]
MFRNAIIAVLFLINVSAVASGGLKSLVSQVDTATTSITFQRLAEESEKIIVLQANNWLAYYWCSFNYTAAAYLSPKNNKDALLDKAQLMLDKSSELKKNEVELLLLQSWIYSTRIAVAPGNRIKEFGNKANIAREKAHVLDPNNPRYYFLKGSFFYFAPPAAGGGKTKAKPLFEESIAKFKSYRPKGDLYPKWGGKQAKELLESCN